MTPADTNLPSEPSPAPVPHDVERGSALIVSMMIMVILTMLGVTFAVLAAQEEKISVNARDHDQTLYAAESALEIARTWFQDPSNTTNLFKPTAAQMNYSLRKGATFAVETYRNADERAAAEGDTFSEVDGSAGNVYTGGNFGGGSSRFEKPYRGTNGNTLWGRPATPDVLLCGDLTLDVNSDGTVDCTATMKQYMDKLNTSLLMGLNLRNAGHSSRDSGTVQIEQIRVYRPPVDFDMHTRYGVATIEVTAVKKQSTQIVARRTVREVLQEIPFPGPGGAIEAEGEISANGSAGVHWGSVVSSSTTDDIKLPGSGQNNFPDASVARQTAARWGFHWTINPASPDHVHSSNPDDPADNGTLTARVTWLTEALGITKNGAPQNFGMGSASYKAVQIEDPWLLFRARRRIIIDTTPITAGPHPYGYRTIGADGQDSVVGNANPEFKQGNNANWSHMFQAQIVRFPPMDYQTWKDVSQSSSQGMFYFKWDGSGGANSVSYKRDGIGASQTWTTWLEQLDRGVFFFDTKDSTKPADDASNLTDAHGWTTNLYVEGFIYLNADEFNSSGAGNGTDTNCNMPGEVFLDDGIDLHQTGQVAGDDCLCIRYDAEDGCVLGVRPIGWQINGQPPCPGIDGDDCTCSDTRIAELQADAAEWPVNAREAETFRNGVWDSDIDNDGFSDASSDIQTLTGWSTFIAQNDGPNEAGGHGYNRGVLPGYKFTKRYRQGMNDDGLATGAHQAWKRDPRFLNHVTEAGWNGTRQPHEPFLNFDAKSQGSTVEAWSTNDHAVKVDFLADADPVEIVGGTVTKTTTRARDSTGSLMRLPLHINGVFYCEGIYTGTGNMKVFGSLLMRGGYAGQGSVDVWFNEDLVKGKFPNPTWHLPRVYASARDTN